MFLDTSCYFSRIQVFVGRTDVIGVNLSPNPFKTSFPASGLVNAALGGSAASKRDGASKMAFPAGDWERDTRQYVKAVSSQAFRLS